jgi:hypothetical protein
MGILVIFQAMCICLQHSKRWSQPDNSKPERRSTLLIEPAPNVVALRTQLRNSHRIKVLASDRLRYVEPDHQNVYASLY